MARYVQPSKHLLTFPRCKILTDSILVFSSRREARIERRCGNHVTSEDMRVVSYPDVVSSYTAGDETNENRYVQRSYLAVGLG